MYLLAIFLLLTLSVPPPLPCSILSHSIHPSLIPPWDLRLTTPDHIHYCLLMSNVTHTAEPTGHFLAKLGRLLESILLISRGIPLHLIFLTEEESIFSIQQQVELSYASAVMDRMLKTEEQGKKVKCKIPRVEVEFVNHKDITDKFEESIAGMKKHFNNWEREYEVKGNDGSGNPVSVGFKMPSRYDKDIFYLTPFYHSVFPLQKMIFSDVDVVFKISLESLYAKFSTFSEDNLYSFAPDLTPHYFTLTQDWRTANPSSPIGTPGPQQGLNTGVGLLHLSRMRASKQLNDFLLPEMMDRLADRLMFVGALGHQDWWNLVSWASPEMISHLPCNYNVQVETEYRQGPWLQTFDLFHECPGNIKILHGHNI